MICYNSSFVIVSSHTYYILNGVVSSCLLVSSLLFCQVGVEGFLKLSYSLSFVLVLIPTIYSDFEPSRNVCCNYTRVCLVLMLSAGTSSACVSELYISLVQFHNILHSRQCVSRTHDARLVKAALWPLS